MCNVLYRILWEIPPDQTTGLTHLMIIAHIDSHDYLVDVGAGPIGCPIPLHIHTQEGIETEYGQHRIVQVDTHTYIHQLLNAHQEWKGSYVFNTSLQGVVQDFVIGTYGRHMDAHTHIYAQSTLHIHMHIHIYPCTHHIQRVLIPTPIPV
ncbi:hypothetical protein EON63_02985 [archaeon]|nr:MAG: hypothetical protein EON63_02985 [archaeon]